MAARTPLLDYYEILGLPRDASPADIEAAFRAETLKIRDVAGSGERTRQIGLAYRALSNPERRRDYDAALTGSPPPSDQAFAEARGPDAPLVADEPWHSAEVEEDRPRGAAGRALVLSLLAGALLLLAGLWLSGLFSSDPKVAEKAPGTAPAADQPAREVFASNREGNSLADALASILPSGSNEAGEGDAAAAGEGAPAASPEAVAGPDAPQPEPSGEGAGNAAATAAPVQQPESEPQPVRQAEAAPAPAAPTPAPAPAVNRSTGPRLLSGGLVDADNQGGRFQGSVSVRLRVGTNGRPQGCAVIRQSGNAALDATTCRLLQERLVFTPARDREGNPVATEVESTHVWGRQRRR